MHPEGCVPPCLPRSPRALSPGSRHAGLLARPLRAPERPVADLLPHSLAAHESLTSLDRRRQFDSVDWEIEDAIPNAASVPAAKYVATFGPVFAREGRFSKRQPVPAFGTDASSKQEVEGFYDFWYKFDSWRSFEWWDKEANEGSDSCVLPFPPSLALLPVPRSPADPPPPSPHSQPRREALRREEEQV